MEGEEGGEEEEEEEEEEQSPSPSPPAVQRVSIAVEETNVLPGALQLIRKLRPQWEAERVKTKVFTEGITNKLMACFTDENMRDAVLVRVYGRKTELIVDRANELRNFQVLQDHGCAPNLYCTFENGYCYEFMPGKALGPEDIRQPNIFRLVAQEMAKMHRIHTNGSLPKPCLWHRLYKYFNLVKTEFARTTSNPRGLVLTHSQAVAYMVHPISCFLHHQFILSGLNEVDYSLYPSKEVQMQWLRYYLQAYKKLGQENQEEGSKSRGESRAVPEEELESLYVQVNQFALASHFLWACWGLIQAQFSTIDFNFARYADIRFKQYFKTKPVVTSLKMSK
ncbi:ethanolamine kinase 2 [Sceloporus undulatus]|uniref:ethanolamine kinase 2 n=1 Tax=Sceloporus undulatus TaxID=8520 RepID=UPI001C4AF16E|nr:ethanolamine kinase 2 [Sceloporus undulatus]